MKAPSEKISFEDLISNVNDKIYSSNNKAISSLSWLEEMSSQAYSEKEMESLRELRAFFNGKMRYGEYHIVITLIMLCLFGGIFWAAGYWYFKQNYSVVNFVVFILALVFTGIVETIIVWIRKNFAAVKYRARVNEFFKNLKSGDRDFKSNKIFVANYIIANLKMANKDLKKKAIAHILKKHEANYVDVDNVKDILKLEMNRILTMNSYDVSTLVKEDIAKSVSEIKY